MMSEFYNWLRLPEIKAPIGFRKPTASCLNQTRIGGLNHLHLRLANINSELTQLITN